MVRGCKIEKAESKYAERALCSVAGRQIEEVSQPPVSNLSQSERGLSHEALRSVARRRRPALELSSQCRYPFSTFTRVTFRISHDEWGSVLRSRLRRNVGILRLFLIFSLRDCGAKLWLCAETPAVPLPQVLCGCPLR